MNEADFSAILAGEREDDLSEAEAEAFAAFLETERGCELLEQAEADLAPLADSFRPIQPSEAAWSRVDSAIAGELATSSGVIVTPPRIEAPRNWSGVLLLAAGLLFAAAIGMFLTGPGSGPGDGSHMVSALVVEPTQEQDFASGQPAVVLKVEAGEGFVAEQSTADSLLVVSVREASGD